MKILFAEDTRDLNRAVSTVLKYEKYEVDSVFDGEEAAKLLETNAYDCIITDIMMPKKDGMQLLAEIRNKHITTPVILLTAKAEIEDRVAGLDAGADDYLPKPFAMKELLARVRSVCRRYAVTQNTLLRFGDITLDPETFGLNAKNSVRLSVKEYFLMRELMENTDKNLSVDTLISKVWQNDEGADKDTVYLYTAYLKGKLFSIGSSVTIIGEYGGSYRLSCDKR